MVLKISFDLASQISVGGRESHSCYIGIASVLGLPLSFNCLLVNLGGQEDRAQRGASNALSIIIIINQPHSVHISFPYPLRIVVDIVLQSTVRRIPGSVAFFYLGVERP